MKTTLIIIRHGETLYNVQGLFQGQMDIELTKKGKRQAACAAKELKNTKIDAIYSSPLKRAFETAQIIKHNRNIDIIINNSITEIKCGRWEGMKINSIREKDAKAFYKWEFEPHLHSIPNGESFSQVFERGSEFLEQAINKHKGKTVVIVSHMVTILLMLTYLADEKIEKVWEIGRQPNAAINIIDIDKNGKINFVTLGNDSHIGKEDTSLPEWDVKSDKSSAVNFV